MYRVALCDDEEAELDKTEQMLKAWQDDRQGMDFTVRRFRSGEELLLAVSEEDYSPDLVLLDIYMQGKTGTETAKELRGMGSECRFLFLTTSRDHALEAFRVDAEQYLVKPVEQAELAKVLDRLFAGLEEERKKYLLLRNDGRLRRVALKDIVYCEARGKTQYLFLENGAQLLLHMTMKEIFEMLSPYPEFVRIGIAYIVSLKYIDSLNAKELSLNDGKKLYLPRGAYQPLRKQYLRYYCEEE